MNVASFLGLPTNRGPVRVPAGYRKSVAWLPRIGDIVPDFVAKTTRGNLTFHDWAEGRWTLLFSHPAAFTPVCSTEIAALAADQDEFDARNVQILGMSGSSLDEQRIWDADLERIFKVQIRFPMAEDPTGELAATFGMVHEHESDALPMRKTLIIDPSLKVRMIFEYPMLVGRSTSETLRVIDALQANDKHGLATPSDWTPGDKLVFPPGTSDASATEHFGRNWRKLSDYLKVVRLPG